MKNIIEEMSTTEKVVLTAICSAALAFLLRVWDPAFFRYFHIVSMQEVSFLRNVWQTAWLVFQIAAYLVWGISSLYLIMYLVISLIIIGIGIIAFLPDILISIWNIMSHIIPIPYVETRIAKRYFRFIEVKTYGVQEKIFKSFESIFSICFVSQFVGIPLISHLIEMI